MRIQIRTISLIAFCVVASIRSQAGDAGFIPASLTSAPVSKASVSYASSPAASALSTIAHAAVSCAASNISPVCDVLARVGQNEKLAYETGELSPICRPFVKLSRRELDRCGDTSKDPYSSTRTSTQASSLAAPRDPERRDTSSKFTWASRNDMARKGKINLLTDPEWVPKVSSVMKRLGDLKESAAKLCCAGTGTMDQSCKTEFDKVQVAFCQPNSDPNAPDPCVFGGSYKMPGEGYNSIFRAIHHNYGAESANEFRRLAEKNLSTGELADPHASIGMTSGNIVLSSYVSKETGTSALEPIVLHEFGHACSMIKMQQAALAGAKAVAHEATKKAYRAAQWLDSARNRCQPDFELPEAYFDFWESLGESRSLAQCLMNLTLANQHQQVDHSCPNLCPGHYLEESVGIAFSLLAGDAGGLPTSVFPNTCDHVRDGQHPMVSDVADCLVQSSPRFREKLRAAYACGQ